MPIINNNVETIKTWLDQGGYLSKLLKDYSEGSFKEIVDLLNNDEKGLEAILKQLDNKVDKDGNKGLSEANFTNEEKEKLSQIQTLNDDLVEKINTCTFDGYITNSKDDLNIDYDSYTTPGIYKVHGDFNDEQYFHIIIVNVFEDKDRIVEQWLFDGFEIFGRRKRYDKWSVWEKVSVSQTDLDEIKEMIKNSGGGGNSSEEIEAIKTALANKVDKVSGKGLSSNDFTDALKTRLENNTFDGVYYYEDNPFGGEGAVDDELKEIFQEGIYKIFHSYGSDYVIGILKVGHYDVEGTNGTYQIFVTMDNDVYKRFDETSNGWQKVSVSQTDLEKKADRTALANKVDKVNGKNPINYISTDLTYLSASNVCDEILNQEEKKYVEGLNFIYNQSNDCGLLIISEYYGTYISSDWEIATLTGDGTWYVYDSYVTKEDINEYLIDYVYQDDFDATVENIEQDIKDLKDNASAINVITIDDLEIDYTKLIEIHNIPFGISVVRTYDENNWYEDYALVIKNRIEDDEHLTVIMANGEIHTNFFDYDNGDGGNNSWQGWTTPYVSNETFNSTIGDIQSLLDSTISLADSYIGEVTE